jgi:Ni/Fe-hydrogenase 1 B-type cytochrome subunit
MAHLAHYKEAHPMPFVITHWINLVSMIFLIISGFVIHFPVAGIMGICRGLHVFFGFLLFVNCIARILMSFFIKSAPTGGTRKKVADFKTWLPQKDNRHQGGAWVKYYLFLKKDHPLSAKLGVPQKLSYLLIPILIILMFITGLCLWPPTASSGFCQFFLNAWGGAMSLRIIHYFGMFVFIIFMFIHVYLANVEGTEPTKLMFFHKEHGGLVYDPDKHVIVGDDTLKPRD